MGADPLLGAGTEALSQYLEHGKIEDWGRVGSAGGGGIAGGLIAVSNPAAALSTVMSAGAGSSALAGVTERLIASGGKSAGTLTEVAVDAATGAGSAGIVKGGASLLRKVLPKKVAPPASKGPVAKAGGTHRSGTAVGYHATRLEYTDSILKTGLRPSMGGRAGAGVYVNNTIAGAKAEFGAHNPDLVPAILRVQYTTGRAQVLEGLDNPYVKGKLPLSGDTLSFQSVRDAGTINTVIRNDSATVLEVSF